MRNSICFLAIVGANLAIWGCQDQNSISPELAGNNEMAAVEKTASQVAYMVDYSQVQVVEDGEQFLDEKGVLHIRGRLFSGAPITGDLVGKNERTLINADIDLASGNGKVFGSYAHQATWSKRNQSGVLKGNFEAKIIAGTISGIRIVPSGDDLMGVKIARTQEEMVPGSMKLKFNSVIVSTHDIKQ